MSEQVSTAPHGQFKDRTVGLVVFGIVQILMGGLFLLMIPMVLVAMTVGPPEAVAGNTQSMVVAIAQYVAFAVIGIWLGIGSILARRWARALTLVLAWIVLVCGVVTLVFLFLFMGDMFRNLAEDAKMPPEALLVMQATMVGMMGCIYIVIPGAFILFYQSRHVRATCEAKDPRVRWTDRCPLPVLALCLMCGFGAFSLILCVPFYGGVIPWFGTFLDGPAGVALSLGIGLVFACLTWGLYKLKKWAWLGIIAVLAALSVSSVVTFSRGGLREMYEKMQLTEQQLEVIEKTGILDSTMMPWMMAISCALYLVYVLWVGRYFFSSRASTGSA